MLRSLIALLLLLLLRSTFQVGPPIELSGIRSIAIKEPNEHFFLVTANERFTFRVLGTNLPGSGYFFTTATKCEDAYDLNISTISTVAVKTVRSYCSYATLTVIGGLPFNVSNRAYHLCHHKGSAVYEKYVTVEELSEMTTQEGYRTDKILLCCVCILLSAYSSGMTLGYMKFSIVELNTMINSGEESLAKRARRIMLFRRRSNYLVIAFSIFSSIFTVLFTTTVEKMLDGAPNSEILKIVVPAMITLVFAEMIPQAVCNSRLGFNLASGLWFVSVVIFVATFPVAYPASLVLDRFLKRDVREVLTQEEKTCMIRNMAKNANEREKTILENATTFTLKKVGELMVPIADVFMLSRSQKLNRPTMLTLVEKGYTRVPIYDDKNRNAIVGMLNMKDLNLVSCDLSKEPTVKEVLRQLENLKEQKKHVKFAAKYVNIEMNAQLLLNQMRTGDFHFACVVKYMPYDSKVVGIITIEDILEELFGKIDENNERKVRSSVDDRADNAVIGWCREAGSDEKYPLSFSQQLRVLQYLLKECQVLRSLDVGILKAKQLLSLERIRIAKKGEKLPLDDLFLVIWKGTVIVKNRVETYEQDVRVPAKRSASIDEMVTARRPPVPVFIVGKSLLLKLMKSLGSPFDEPLGPQDYFSHVTAVSDEVSYFKIRLDDLLNTINGCTMTRKADVLMAGESFIQCLNSRQSTPLNRTPSTTTEPNLRDRTPLLSSADKH